MTNVDPCGACGYRCCSTCSAALALLTLEASGEASEGTLDALAADPCRAETFRDALAGHVSRAPGGRLDRTYLLGCKVRGMMPRQSARDTAAYAPTT